MLLAACTAMYVTASEFKDKLEWKELQQEAADNFCDLIELNETEFNALGLTFES